MSSPFSMMRFRNRFQPDTEAYDEYSEHIESAPDPADYNPSIWRRIGAALTGGLAGLRDPGMGLKVSEDIIQGPYRQAAASHEGQRKHLYERAKLEQETNELGRQAANDELDAEVAWMGQEAANARHEATLQQRKTEAETRAAAAAAEQERKTKADALLDAHRRRMAAVAERNATTNAKRGEDYSKFVQKYGSKPESNRVTPLDQKRIRQMAVIEVTKDPKFSKVPVGPDGSYDISKLDPASAEEFENLLALYEHDIANKKKQDYTFSGNSNVLEEDLEFERRLQDEDESFWGRWR